MSTVEPDSSNIVSASSVQASSGRAPVAVIGAGPVGLAAAAHLLQRGLPVRVFEAAGRVAGNLATFGHVRLFSPWRFNVDTAARELLLAHGWTPPDPEALPTAAELMDHYLRPLAAHPALVPHIRCRSRVLGISRHGVDKAKTAAREAADFVLRIQTPDGVEEFRASAVIDASGTWAQPNPAGAHGWPALGEQEAHTHIAYGMPDVVGALRPRYAGRRVLVVGAGHSAAGNLLALATLAEQEPATRVVWAVRGRDLRRLFGGGQRDGLPARGALGQGLQQLLRQGRLELREGFAIRAIATETTAAGATLVVHALDTALAPIREVDEIIVATGARPDTTLSSELRVQLDPWLESTEALAPLIDPNVHSCGTVRPHGHRELAHAHEPGYYAIGAKSYGRAPNFLLATGYEQARSVVAALAGDLAAADTVQLVLPETGVCSVDLAAPQRTSACCPTAATPRQQPATTAACCA